MPWLWATYLHQSCRDVPRVQERAEALMGLAAEQGFPYWLAVGTIFAGLGLGPAGEQSAEEIARLRQGLAAYRATGAELNRTYWLALLAEAHGTVGQAEEGLGVLSGGVGGGGQKWRAAMGGRAVSAQGRIAAAPDRVRMHSKRKPVFARPSPWPAASRRSRSSCGRR